MAALILDSPPDNENWWIPPDALPGIEILYTPGRNTKDSNGRWSYHSRKRRTGCYLEIFHTMGGSSTESLQGFANSEMGANATLAELATFTDGRILQSLPLNIIGAGSVAGGATGITNETAEIKGDPNLQPLTEVQLETKAQLTAWMIKNPLGWKGFEIPYQVCKSPTPSRPDRGGLGAHTMWGICGVSAGGTNPWSLYCKSCPGWYKRGTRREIMFPNSAFTDIPWQFGNFRHYSDRVAQLLEPNVPQPPITPDVEDNMLFQIRKNDLPETSVFPHLYVLVNGKCIWLPTDADADVVDLTNKFGNRVYLAKTNGKKFLDVFEVPNSDRPAELHNA